MAQKKSLQAILWAFTLRELEGGMSFGKIEKKAKGNPKNFWDTYTGRLEKNSLGVPVKDKNFIKEMNDLQPGTARILSHPLWDILFNPQATSDEIYQYMDRLEPRIKNKLFSYNTTSGLIQRKELRLRSHVYYIAKLNNIDALACLLMLARESEIKGAFQAWRLCLREAKDLWIRLSIFEPYKHIDLILIELIFNNFIKDSLLWKMSTISEVSFKTQVEITKRIQSNVLKLNIIPSEKEKHIEFLFWVGFEDQFLVDSDLEKMRIEFETNNTFSYYPSIAQVLEMMHGDSRRYLSGGAFLI
jgi:hypothetical protein